MRARTEVEFRQVENERDFWRRKCEALERKYGQFRGRSFLAITVRARPGRLVAETVMVKDAEDSVRVNNFLTGIENEIFADCGAKEGA